jgi:phosphotriesterase-related protein
VIKAIGKYFFFLAIFVGCTSEKNNSIQTVTGTVTTSPGDIWLSHEHILVDFTGADSIDSKKWDHDSVIDVMSGYLEELKQHKVKFFVDATPAYLGRDVLLLEKFAKNTGLSILTNTGYYGAVKDKYIPSFAFKKTAEELAEIWINEYENGIEGTSVKPGFIKISVDAKDTLDAMDEKLIRAAAITHLKTGLLILSHTGHAKGLWPQLKILKEMKVSADAFVWVHAQIEEDNNNYLQAANEGCWIAFDGLGWELEKHIEKIVFAKQNGMLDKILVSNDAGWYDPQKKTQDIKPYTNTFKHFYPALKQKGITDREFELLVSVNPSKAFSIKIRKQ